MNSNDRSIIGIVIVTHAIVHTYELSIPVLMVLWLLEFSVSTALLGVVVAVGYGLFGAGALPGGILVDRFGSQELVTACLVGMGASFLVLSLAPNALTIMVALCVWGLAASVYHPAGLSLISKGIEERGTGFAYYGDVHKRGVRERNRRDPQPREMDQRRSHYSGGPQLSSRRCLPAAHIRLAPHRQLRTPVATARHASWVPVDTPQFPGDPLAIDPACLLLAD